MASVAASAVVLPPSIGIPRKTQKSVRYIEGINSYGGLKAQNAAVLNIGRTKPTQECFAAVVTSVRSTTGKRRGRSGGALAAKCDKVGEIFKIAFIMNGLTLLGVAVGFILLRIEASVEESE